VLSSNVAVGILLGASLQKLWELVRSMQMIVLISLVDLNFPAISSVFFSVCFELQKIDILNGEEILAILLDLKETPPLNSKFEMFGIGDMNFISNSGSYSLISIGILGFFILRETLARCMISCRKNKLARRIGIASHVSNVRS
jgi:hypothetical protein